jgi:predicted transcriptional regulator
LDKAIDAEVIDAEEAFVQHLKDRSRVHRAIDSDHENSTLKRFHPESDFINLEHRREIDRMFTAAESCDLLVIDCRAASTDLFIDFFDEVGSRSRCSASTPESMSPYTANTPTMPTLATTRVFRDGFAA